MNYLKETTQFIEPFGIEVDLTTGVLRGATNHLVRKASAMRGHYGDAAALEKLIAEGDPVHYEVFEKPVPEEFGHLMYCVSVLHPGKVGNEYFMTKGHYHEALETAEIYLCLSGQGLMAMKTKDGKFRTEPMHRNRMVYVPPYWAHRSVNTGAEPLISFCVYPAEAGHNYGDIELEGFPARIIYQNGTVVIEKKSK